VPVVLIPSVFIHWMLQGVTFEIGDQFAPWLEDDWAGWIRADRKGDRLAQGREERWSRQFRTRLGRALAYEELPAIGVLLSGGGLVRIPHRAWLFARYADGPSHSDQFEMALTGSPIFATTPSGEECWPMVAKVELTDWAGASVKPDPPIIAADEMSGPTITKRHNGLAAGDAKIERAKTMHDWMHGYAQARADAGRIIKRDEALKLLQRHFPRPITTREHEDAYEALP
jgi:hypothetical protein